MTSVRVRLPPDAFALLCAVVLTVGIFFLGLALHPGWPGADALSYQAAAERLNAGHQLYALSPGDRPLPMNPPYWTVPLLSPPLIAVLWRPLALLPYPAAIAIWYVAMLLALTVSTAAILRAPRLKGRRRYLAAIVVALLSQALAVEALSANVDAVLVAGAIVVWRAPRKWDPLVGVIVAVMAGVKLLPIAFGWWLICQRRWKAVAWLIGGLAVLGVVSLAGAGLQAHLTYLSIARQTTDGGATPESLSTVAQVLGVPAAIAATAPVAFFIACAGVMFALRDRPGVTYAIAVLASVFGSPVVNNENLVRLLPILLPLGDSKPTEKGIV